MKKVTKHLVFCLGLISSGYATNNFPSGFSLEVSAGTLLGNTQISRDYSTGGGGFDKNTLASSSGFLGFSAGCSEKVDSFYIGGKAFGLFSNHEQKWSSNPDNFINQTWKSKSKYSMGFSVQPGFILNNNTLLYCNLGFIRSKVETTLTDNSGTDPEVRNSCHKNGLLLGIGADFAICNKTLLGLFYNQHRYSKIKELSLPTFGTCRAKPTLHQLGVSIRYVL